jgi:hypothetical protein
MAVMQQHSNIVAALAHDLKPPLRDRPQFSLMLTHPDLDRRISLDRNGEPEELAHGEILPTLHPVKYSA